MSWARSVFVVLVSLVVLSLVGQSVWAANSKSKGQQPGGHLKITIRQVEVSADGGETWAQAHLEPRRQWSRQRFSHKFRTDSPGPIKLVCRATDAEGQTQPESGARNEYHTIAIDVTDD